MQIRRWLEKRNIWFCTINDNPGGSRFWHGRAFFHFGRLTFSTQWGFANFAKRFALMFYLRRSERLIAINLAIPFLWTLHFALEGVPGLNYTTLETDQRDIGVRVFDWRIWTSLWGDDSGYGPHRQRVINVERIMFGKYLHEKEWLDPEPVPIEVTMPEASYPGTAQRFVSTTGYARFRKAQRTPRVNIEIPQGIPIPGKGENVWDLGDDAIFALTCPAESIDEAIEELRQSAFRTRRKHGWDG